MILTKLSDPILLCHWYVITPDGDAVNDVPDIWVGISPEQITWDPEIVLDPLIPKTVRVIVCSTAQDGIDDKYALTVIWSPSFKLPRGGVYVNPAGEARADLALTPFTKYSKVSAPIVPVESNVTLLLEHSVSLESPDVKLSTGVAAESTVTVTVFEDPKSAVPGHWTPLNVE